MEIWGNFLLRCFRDGKHNVYFQTFAYRGVVDNYNVKLRDMDNIYENRPVLILIDRNSGDGIKIVYSN